ncbi:MAG: cysteine desulfurase family protein [Cyanobacteria bacterium P01_E01_bin.42]
MPPIYLDYHATTPCDRRVANKILQTMVTAFGNASSVDHSYGDEAAQAVKKARQQIAELLNASPTEIIFTSGATESINLAIQGHFARNSTLSRLIVSPIEHKAVLDTCRAIASQKLAEIVWLKVDRQARLDLDYLERVCSQGASLLCIMAANNEVGTIYPLQTISQIAQKYRIPFFCDASQAIGKIPINFADSGITYLTLSGHKLYATKGIGALIVRRGHPLKPLFYGGEQQNGLRPGTLNVSGIVGLGEACHLRRLEMNADEQEIQQKRDRLQNLLLAKIPNLVINGDRGDRLAGNLHISIPNLPNSAIMARIRDKLAISTGSACSSGTTAPSHVLRVMQLPESHLEGAFRIGLGKFTTDAECDRAAEILTDAVAKVAQLLD